MRARAVVLFTETENHTGRKKPLSCEKAGEMSKDCHTAEYKLHVDSTVFFHPAETNRILYVLIVILVFVALIGIVVFIIYYKNKGKKLTGT